MMIGMGLFWLAIILGFVCLVRDGAGQRRQDPPTDNALTILDRRFAEAVSLDEYRQRRDVLTDAAAPHTNQHVTAVLTERS